MSKVNKITFTNNYHIIVCGDIHGEFDYILKKICNNINDSIVIICGDIGMGFNKPQSYIDTFNKYHKKLKLNNTIVIMFRGNHDDPSYFNGEKNTLFNHYSNILLIPDYTIIENYYFGEKQNVLCIGGAISIDRSYRQMKDLEEQRRCERYKSSFCKKTYWSMEAVEYNIDKLDYINDNYDIRVVCTHTAPSFAPPITKDGIQGWLLEDFYLSDDLDNERLTMTKIYDRLKIKQDNIKYWCYGHFHSHNSLIVDETNFLLSNIDELNELRL